MGGMVIDDKVDILGRRIVLIDVAREGVAQEGDGGTGFAGGDHRSGSNVRVANRVAVADQPGFQGENANLRHFSGGMASLPR